MAKSTSSSSSGSAYSDDTLSSFGQAMKAPIGGLGGVGGTSAYANWGGGMGGSPTYGGGYSGSVGDSRTFSALSPRSQTYMRAGSPGGNYGAWVKAGGGGQGGGVGQGPEWLQQLLSMLFQQRQQQERPDYSHLFANSQVDLESPTITQPVREVVRSNYNTFSNDPRYSFGNIDPYKGRYL